jgi:hypothetical protein
MNHRSSVFAVPLLALTLMGAGCMDRLKPAPVPRGVQKQEVIQGAFESSTSTLGVAATSTPAAVTSTAPVVEEPRSWNATVIRGRSVGFRAPSGYWVLHSESRGRYYLVPGTVPPPTAPDPSDEVQKTYVATIGDTEMDPVSFPSWERFELTMAQFACTHGTSTETLVICLDKPTNVINGLTDAGLRYKRYTLQSVQKKDQKPVGPETFFMVRLGAQSNYGILVHVTDPSGMRAATDLVESMRIRG